MILTTFSLSVELTEGRGRWTEQPRTPAAPGHARGSSSALLPGNQNHRLHLDTEASIIQ